MFPNAPSAAAAPTVATPLPTAAANTAAAVPPPAGTAPLPSALRRRDSEVATAGGDRQWLTLVVLSLLVGLLAGLLVEERFHLHLSGTLGYLL